jgi:uncharacterized repeat protein (TIGR01451 family)
MTIIDTIPAPPLTGISLGTVSSGLTANLVGNVVTTTLSTPLLPTQCRLVEVNFTIPLTATVGSTITNCAIMQIPGAPPREACASFVVNAPSPKPCLRKQVCNELPSYMPGDTLRYRLRIQNIGGLPITGATITDILNPNLEYVGNPSYRVGSSWSAPCNPSSNWSGVAFSQTGNTLSFTLPSIPATCQSIFYNNCGLYGTTTVPYYFIEFDVRVSDTTALGNIPNIFSIAGGTVTSPVNSNTELINVIGTSGFFLDKSVAKDTTSWASSTTTGPGSNVNYRLQFSVAPGSVGLRHITFADLLPRDDGTNDNLILGPCTPRGSFFDVNWVSSILTAPPATDHNNAASFSNVNNFMPPGSPGTMFSGGCGTAGSWASGISTGNTNLGYYFGSTPVGAGNTATSMFTVGVPSSAKIGEIACNTFAANAAVRHLINSTIISDQIVGELESSTACITVEQDTSHHDCFSAVLKSVTASGVDPVGNCTYTIDLTLTNPGPPILGWFESDQGSITPPTLTVPTGTSTQTYTFTDLPPTDNLICIRYGIMVNNQRVLCDSLCFDIPPCGSGGPCDSLSMALKSIITTGVTPDGNCTYSIDLTATNSSFLPISTWFESDQGTLAPATASIPPGASSVLLTFVDTPPSDTTICIRYGYNDSQGIKVICDSICVTLPPCGDDPCDSIKVQLKSIINSGVDPATGDCLYTVDLTVTNSGTTPILTYFESLQGLVAPPVLTIPVGTSTQTFTFTDTTPTDAFVCIRYGLFVGPQPGMRVLCDSVCFDLPPCGEDPCDSLDVSLKSIVSTGVDPATGDCIYTVDLTVVNSGTTALSSWFDSFQGLVAPPVLTIPVGTSTQTLTFTDTPPTDATVCIRYGLIVGPQPGQRILCDSICFEPPPCGDEGDCDSLTIHQGSATSTGVDATGNCTYSIALTMTNAGSSPINTWFESFQGTVAPVSLSVPTGTSTQTLTFTDTPPTDAVVCIRYGVFLGGQKRLCDSVCVDIPPCDSNPCDSLINGHLNEDCCEYSVTLVNGVGSPITSINYTVTNGTVDYISTLPCIPVTPAPFGSSSGVLTYSPPCTSNINFDIAVTPTSTSSPVTVELVVYHGQDSCVLRFSYDCDPKPILQCDDVKVKPFHFHGLSLSGRTFKVTNNKIPVSPITHIDINLSPTPCILSGGGLKVDFVSTSWSLPYTRIPTTGFISANSQVRFNLGIDYSCLWTGSVSLVIHHADGDSCVYTYGPWKALQPVIGTGVLIADKFKKRVYANKLRLNNTSTAAVKWVSVNVTQSSDVIVAGSGREWNGAALEPQYAVLDDHAQGMNEALFSFERPIPPGSTSDFFNLVVARDSTQPGTPVVRWVSYDEDGNAIATDTVGITGTVLAIRGMGESAQPDEFKLLQFFPNPTTNLVTVNYLLGRSTSVSLELFNQLGEFVDTIEKGHKYQGMQTVRYNMTGLPAGQYYLVLSSDAGQITKPLVIVR